MFCKEDIVKKGGDTYKAQIAPSDACSMSTSVQVLNKKQQQREAEIKIGGAPTTEY